MGADKKMTNPTRATFSRFVLTTAMLAGLLRWSCLAQDANIECVEELGVPQHTQQWTGTRGGGLQIVVLPIVWPAIPDHLCVPETRV